MPTTRVADLVDAIQGDLVSSRHWDDATFLRLPLIYPSGTAVTVKIGRHGNDSLTVSDGGFGYRELESFGGQRSFAKTADSVIAPWGVSRDKRCVFAEVRPDEIVRGVSDVATASWQIVDRIYDRFREEDGESMDEYLTERLVEIFGEPRVISSIEMTGASSSTWEMSALVIIDGKKVAFQAVSHYPASIYRTNAAFDDLAALDLPPTLVAVVQSKQALGPKLGLLARQGYVIEAAQPDAVYRRAAA